MLMQRVGLGRYEVRFTSYQQRVTNVGLAQWASGVVQVSEDVVVKLESYGRRNQGCLTIQVRDRYNKQPCDIGTWQRDRAGQYIPTQVVKSGEYTTTHGLMLSLESDGRPHSAKASLIQLDGREGVREMLQTESRWHHVFDLTQTASSYGTQYDDDDDDDYDDDDD
ncbi:hypothetical protein QJQ45_008927 [Haematococcus lacustris]|nr:hypothetical protein QJQ45_008780 [Haematococcus lacustris]KAJ9521606.1 hypothetical protein QJQ45_008940 [Haematococcus lacustris]KAJ9521609.1 hypothetical protein QJQ45_008927 [Haematococcus lacustris]